jgi:hypothetical protein
MAAANLKEEHSTKLEEISFKELLLRTKRWFRYLLSKWWVIMIFVLLGSALGYYYAKTKKPTFVAYTSFVLEEDKSSSSSLGSLAGLASVAGIDLGSGGGIFQGDNILELYKSRTMIVKALLTEVDHNGRKISLIDQYLNFKGLRETWSKNPKLKNLSFSTFGKPADSADTDIRLKDSILNTVVADINKNILKVDKPDKTLSIIKAEVKATDEFFAKAFDEAIVATVNDFYKKTKTKRSLDNVVVLQEKTDSVRKVIKGAIFSAATVADATPNLNPTRQAQRIAPIQSSQFTKEANVAILSELVKNLEMSKMALLKETPLIQVVDAPIYPLPVEQFGKAKGLLLGGILFGFLIVIVLTIKRLFQQIIN